MPLKPKPMAAATPPPITVAFASTSPSVPPLPPDDELVTAAVAYRRARARDSFHNHVDGDSFSGLAYPAEGESRVWLKCGAHVGEGRMQDYAYQRLQTVPAEERQHIRVPEVYRILQHAQFVVIVMEVVHGRTYETILKRENPSPELQETILSLAAKAISLFLAFPVPAGTTRPGPGVGSMIRHQIFKDQEAVVEYESVAALEDHFNNVIRINTSKDYQGGPHHIDFSHERLCFCYADMQPFNLMYTEDGDLFVIDFGHAGFLPVSFMTFSLYCASLTMGMEIRKRLPTHADIVPDSKNVRLMQSLLSTFVFSSTVIGLPKKVQRTSLYTAPKAPPTKRSS